MKFSFGNRESNLNFEVKSSNTNVQRPTETTAGSPKNDSGPTSQGCMVTQTSTKPSESSDSRNLKTKKTVQMNKLMNTFESIEKEVNPPRNHSRKHSNAERIGID